MHKTLDECYTSTLRVVVNIRLGTYVTNDKLYNGVHKVNYKIAARRMRPAQHNQRHQELPASKSVM